MSASYQDQLLEYALRYHAAGIALLKVPYKQKGLRRRGWEKPSIHTEKDVREAFSSVSNVSAIWGHVSANLTDLDLDDAFAIPVADRYLPETATYGREGKPRSHRIFRTSDWSAATKQFKDPLTAKVVLELRGDGSQTVLPGSVHESGQEIRWAERELEFTSIARDDLLAKTRRTAAVALLAKYWPDGGGRHYTAMALAGWLAHNGWTEDDVATLVATAAEVGGDEEWRDRERVARETVQRFHDGHEITGYPTLLESLHEKVAKTVGRWLELAKTRADAGQLRTTDVGNADRFVALHKDTVRYCPELKTWLVWNGKIWEPDVSRRVIELVQQAHQTIYAEVATKAKTQEERIALSRWAVHSEGLRPIEATEKLARSREELVVRAPDLDKDPWLLAVENGTINLRTGDRQQPDSQNYMTRIVPVRYDVTAEMPLLHAMLLESLGSQEMVDYLQRCVGLTLAGVVEKALIVCFGPTDTGKTTFMSTMLQASMGPYATQLPEDALSAHRKGDLAMWNSMLFGRRLGVLSEPNRDMKLDVAFIKAVTGGNKVVARELYKMPFEYVPTATIWLDTNWRPEIADPDDATWNRMKPIFFRNRVRRRPGEDGYVAGFEDKIKAELPGFLRWAVEGCLIWQQEGLNDPPDVVAARTEYRSEQDEFAAWLTKYFETGEDYKTPVADAWDAYQDVKRHMSNPLGKSAFITTMEAKGHPQVMTVNENGSRARVYTGLRLRPRQSDSFDVHGGLRH